MHQKRFLKVAVLFIALFLSPLFAFAQTTTAADQPTNDTLEQQINQLIQDRKNAIPTASDIRKNAVTGYLDIKTNPQNPGPGETVHITITSYLTDLSKATITWSINGKISDKGAGKTSFSFQNGVSGEVTRLTISIVSNEGDRVTKELSFHPVGITVLWEADTYTPPFYRGKALITPQARVRAIAVPSNTNTRNALDAGNLVYVWKKDGTTVSDASGYGKNSFSFLGPKPYGEARLQVAASSLDDTVKSEMQINLPLVQPFILFYEDHPLLGVWQNIALNTNLNLTKKEFSVSAAPYFFSNEAVDSTSLFYGWSLNGKSITNSGHTITLRNETGGKGDSALTLAMRGIKQTFQSASRSLTIHFTSEEPSQTAF